MTGVSPGQAAFLYSLSFWGIEQKPMSLQGKCPIWLIICNRIQWVHILVEYKSVQDQKKKKKKKHLLLVTCKESMGLISKGTEILFGEPVHIHTGSILGVGTFLTLVSLRS
jgi:hypothetical protein